MRSGKMHLLVKKRVRPDIGLMRDNMTGKWRLPPRVSIAREKMTPKSMDVDGVVPRYRKRTTLRSRTNIRRIPCVRNDIRNRVSPR